MTDRRAKRPRSSGAMLAVLGALSGFMILFAALSFQMRAGHDPAVKATPATAPPRTILKRRIIETRVIITDAPAPAGGGAASRGVVPAAGAVRQVAAPAPTAVAPAPAPPAPAPPPAPVTRTS